MSLYDVLKELIIEAMESRAINEESLIGRSSGREALNHAIAAADLYMRAATEARTPSERSRLRRKCEELITHAEHLKVGHGRGRGEPSTGILQSQTRPIPSAEKAILLRSSRLHGNHFPPWQSEPDDDDFVLGHGDVLYTDNTEFTMSSRQREILDGWKRPVDLVGSRGTDEGSASAFMGIGAGHDLVQDITTDCSVVASLCAAMKILMAGKQPILSTLMFPFDHEKRQPRVSPNGKYVFRMHFNGCSREVVVDDRLPSSRTNRTLFVVDRQNPRLVWPALMEKAYLKVRGGYDFPGSNSGTDLYVLTGWIPEQLFLQSEDIDLDRTWGRIKSAYDLGDVVVTLGTGRLSRSEEDALGLVGEHDYAVLDLDNTTEARRLLVKNPWCEDLIWKGFGSSTLIEPVSQQLATSSFSDGTVDSPLTMTPGSFWISMEDVAQNFESMYLNWNPYLFTHRQDHHFTWRVPRKNSTLALAYNPQYSLRADTDETVWILLNRHFADEELDIARQRASSLAAVSRQLGFMGISIFDGKGTKVQVRDGAVYSGPFVDSPQTLAKFNVVRGRSYTVVLTQQDLPLASYSFTLTFFSRSTLHIKPAEEEMAYYQEFSSSWTRRTAGGNAASSTYSHNPQFSISLPQRTPLSILLSTGDIDVAVHLDLVWAHGNRVASIAVKDVVGSSGDYRRGCAFAQIPMVDAGTYTVVCSTFESGQLADFTMRIGSMVECIVQPVLTDSAGLLQTRLPPFVFSEGEECRRAKVTVARLTRAHVVTRYGPSTSTDLNGQHIPTCVVRVSLIYGHGPHETILAVSGDGGFREPTRALRTPEFDIEPDRLRRTDLWLVIEQMGNHRSRQSIEVEFLSDNAVLAGGWEVVDR